MARVCFFNYSFVQMFSCCFCYFAVFEFSIFFLFTCSKRKMVRFPRRAMYSIRLRLRVADHLVAYKYKHLFYDLRSLFVSSRLNACVKRASLMCACVRSCTFPVFDFRLVSFRWTWRRYSNKQQAKTKTSRLLHPSQCYSFLSSMDNLCRVPDGLPTGIFEMAVSTHEK